MPKYYEGEAVVKAFTETTNQSATWARGVLARMKEADVEPIVHAHWEHHKSVCTGEGRKGCFECSACKAAIYEEVFDLMYECGQTKRCGACGAQMDEEEEK